MTTPPRQTVEIGTTVALRNFGPGTGPILLEFQQDLLVVADRVAGEAPLLAQMPEKCDREGIRG